MPSRIAEIISVGTELLLGEIIDTNAVFLAKELRNFGIFVFFKSTSGDNLSRECETIERALKRSDFVIISGGLGPTADDLTREAISDVLGEVPQEDPILLKKLSDLFLSRNREMPEINRKQAWLIPSAACLENPIGTACGWFVKKNGKTIVALPGPPHEMKKMWIEQVVPRLPPADFSIYRTTFRTFGLGEGDIAQILKHLTSFSNPSVATYALSHGVDVRVSASAETIEMARQLASPIEIEVSQLINEHIYGRDQETLSEAIGKILIEKKQTFSAIESLTGGLVSDLITDIPGASNYFRGGLVAYQNEIKVDFGVPESIISRFGVVSEQVAGELAHAARVKFGTDWGVSTTGVAGPSQVDGNPVGTAFIAVEGPNIAKTRKINWPGERRQIKQRVANSVLMLLFKTLRSRAKIT